MPLAMPSSTQKDTAAQSMERDTAASKPRKKTQEKEGARERKRKAKLSHARVTVTYARFELFQRGCCVVHSIIAALVHSSRHPQAVLSSKCRKTGKKARKSNEILKRKKERSPLWWETT